MTTRESDLAPSHPASTPFKQLPHFTGSQALGMQCLTYLASAGFLLGVFALLTRDRPALLLTWQRTEVGVGVIMGLTLLALSVAQTLVLTAIPATRPLLAWFDERNRTLFAHLPPAILAVMALLAGLIEEILWRGWLQAGLLGLAGTALLFAFAHFPPNQYRYGHPATWGMIALYLPTAFLFGWLFEARAHDLTAPIIAHWTLDLIGLGIIALQARQSPPTPTSPPVPPP